MKPKSRLALAVFISLATTLQGIAQVSSTFDVDSGGWRIVCHFRDGRPVPAVPSLPEYLATDGNPAGHIWDIDDQIVTNALTGELVTDATFFYFDAPTRFLGERGDYYGGALSYDIKPSDLGNRTNFITPEVILMGSGGVTLMADLLVGAPLADAWTTYCVQLDTSALWRVENRDGPPATQFQIQSVLSNLEAIRIRGEYSANGEDKCALDNVSLCRTDGLTASKNGGLVVISWSQLGCHQALEFADTLSSPISWQPYSGTTVTGGGRVWATNSFDAPVRFFRLR